MYSWLPSPERIGPADFGNLRRDNWAAIEISAIDKLSPTKYFLLINDLDLIVGNRAKNSESIGKAIFGDTLIKVLNDPQSINNQITYLKDDFYIDSRITGRNQIQDDDIFFADELVIQTAHKPGASRINQVETISKFQKCSEEIFEVDNSIKPSICGVQYVASYGSKVGDPSSHAIKTNKYKLTFEFIES